MRVGWRPTATSHARGGARVLHCDAASARRPKPHCERLGYSGVSRLRRAWLRRGHNSFTGAAYGFDSVRPRERRRAGTQRWTEAPATLTRSAASQSHSFATPLSANSQGPDAGMAARMAGKAWGCCPAAPWCLERGPMSLRLWLCLYVSRDPVGILPTSELVPLRGFTPSVRSFVRGGNRRCPSIMSWP